MGLIILRFLILVSLVTLNSSKVLNTVHAVPHLRIARNNNLQYVDTEEIPFAVRSLIVQKSKEKDFDLQKSTILKAASNIIDSKSIEEMIKRLNSFSKSFPKGILNEKHVKPFIGKFKGDFKRIMVSGKSVFDIAKKLEKSGEKKNKKQLATFKTKNASFTKLVDKFTKSVKLESKKQKNKNLKSMKQHPDDISVLTNAKLCISMADLASDTIKQLQLVPGKINCLIFKNCKENNDDNNANDTIGGGDNETPGIDEGNADINGGGNNESNNEGEIEDVNGNINEGGDNEDKSTGENGNEITSGNNDEP